MRLWAIILSLIIATTGSARMLECAYADADTIIDISIHPDESNGTIEVDNRFLDLECETSSCGAMECTAYFSTSIYTVSIDRHQNEASVTRIINGFAGPIHTFLGVAHCR